MVTLLTQLTHGKLVDSRGGHRARSRGGSDELDRHDPAHFRAAKVCFIASAVLLTLNSLQALRSGDVVQAAFVAARSLKGGFGGGDDTDKRQMTQSQRNDRCALEDQHLLAAIRPARRFWSLICRELSRSLWNCVWVMNSLEGASAILAILTSGGELTQARSASNTTRSLGAPALPFGSFVVIL